jgi:polar amino acid transport system substrate-binding protein
MRRAPLRFAASATTTSRSIIDDLIRPVTPPLTIESQDGRIAAVESHAADAMFLDLPVARAVVDWSSGLLSIACKLDQTEPIAAALPKGSGNVDAVSSALRAMENDGTLDHLATRWLGRSLTSLSDNLPLLRTDAN